MKTEKGFVIGFSKNSAENFCWFVRHSKINDGHPIPINRGDLEWYLNKCKAELKMSKRR